jgi:1,4-alpha-glucan branching enzyme
LASRRRDALGLGVNASAQRHEFGGRLPAPGYHLTEKTGSLKGVCNMSQVNEKNIRLRMSISDADSVNAVGEFNNWSTLATPLTQTGENIWELRLPAHVEVEKLGFFVIAKGQPFGRVINHADLLYS